MSFLRIEPSWIKAPVLNTVTQNENTMTCVDFRNIENYIHLTKNSKKSFFVFQNMKPVLPRCKETMIFLLFPTPWYSEKKKIFKDAVKVVKSISQHLIKCWRVVIFHLRKYFLKRPLEKFPRILSFCQCRWQIPNNNNKKELPNISIEQRPKYVLLNAEHTSLKIIETVLFIFCVRRTNNRYVVFHL